MNNTEYPISIREMNETDIPVIVLLDEKITGIPRPRMWEKEIIHYLKNNGICLVAEIQERVMGFMIGTIRPWLFGIENGGWIEVFGVHPEHTAKGIGKKLGIRLLDEFKGRNVKEVHTCVEWSSTDLLEFFKTLGMTNSEFITLVKNF
ncbi:MAG: N-acetyltransferase family protein [Candidatus Hodarchaeales archaeon]|jgi:GNAT superfamily N-acetyltransferase